MRVQLYYCTQKKKRVFAINDWAVFYVQLWFVWIELHGE